MKKLFFNKIPSPLDRELCVSRKKQKNEITPSGHESLGETSRLHCVQNDNTRLFCHSEEQGDKESGVMQRSPLNNEQGIAALVSIILAIIILGSVAFNFVAETRQKQSGSILTYTSTNSLMIAEAGLRLTQKCLTVGDITWGCPAILQANSDWATITSADNFNKNFGGGGNFAIRFPGDPGNDAGKILVISTGTFRGAQRSLSRFITRSLYAG